MRLSLGFALVGLSVVQASTIKYSVVPGYFLQDEESTDPSKFDYVSVNSNFGNPWMVIIQSHVLIP
jgi:hypothetical protein